MPKPQPPRKRAAAKKKPAAKKTVKKAPNKKVAKKAVTKATKPAAKVKPAPVAKPKPKAKAGEPKKRNRQSGIPLFAEIELGKIKELLGNDDSALVTVSRNFVLKLQKDQIESEAQLKLGI